MHQLQFLVHDTKVAPMFQCNIPSHSYSVLPECFLYQNIKNEVLTEVTKQMVCTVLCTCLYMTLPSLNIPHLFSLTLAHGHITIFPFNVRILCQTIWSVWFVPWISTEILCCRNTAIYREISISEGVAMKNVLKIYNLLFTPLMLQKLK